MAQEKIQELKDEGYYLWVDKKNCYLYDTLNENHSTLEAIDKDLHSSIKRHLPKITDKTFLPNNITFIPDGLGFKHNTYKTYQSTHAKNSDLRLWHEYLERLFPLENERNFIIQYLAHMFQKPEERPTFALLFTSESGTGKGFLYHNILAPLLSFQCCQEDNYGDFLGRFSKSLSNTLLCMLDDPKSNHASTMTKMKSRISEPMISVEEKYADAKTVKVFTRIILASNERTPLHMEESDLRRWYAPSYIKHLYDQKETASFIKKLSSDLDLNAIHAWFMEVSLADFNPHNPPVTSTLMAMQDNSRPMLQVEVEAFLNESPVFTWEGISDVLTGGFFPNELQEILRTKGYKSKRIQINSTRKTLWFDSSISPKEAKIAYEGLDFFS